MSRKSKKKPTTQSRIIARLLGMLLMAGILVILGFVGLKFLEGMNKRQTPQQSNAEIVAPKPEPVAAPPVKKPRYDFYHELAGRKAEVEAEIEHKLETTAKVPEVKGSNYRIQVGAFREQEQATRMHARMVLRDYPVTIIRSGKFYLVQIGPYKEKESAERVQRRLKSEGVDTLLKAYVNN